MKVEDFNYDLPEELIAQTPLEERDASRLLVLDKESGKTSFVLKICDNKFDQCYIPSIYDEIFFKTILFVHCNKKYEINFIVSNNDNVIMEADCYIILYDLTSITALVSSFSPISLAGNTFVSFKTNVSPGFK